MRTDIVALEQLPTRPELGHPAAGAARLLSAPPDCARHEMAHSGLDRQIMAGSGAVCLTHSWGF